MPKILINGVLQEVSEEEARNLQSKQSAEPSPITPMGTAATGATEQEAAMAGTKAQKTEALRIDTETEREPTTLARHDRVARPADEIGTEERQSLRKSEQISKLGSLGARVDQLIQEQFTQSSVPTEVDDAIIDTLDEDTKASVELNIDSYKEALGSGDQNAIDTAYNALQQSFTTSGMPPAERDAYLAQVNGYIQSISDSVLRPQERLSLQDSKLASLDDATRLEVEAIINAYQNAITIGNPTDAYKALVALQVPLGLESPEEVQDYLKSIEDSTGESISSNIIDTVSLADVGVEELGITPEEMVELFGDEWAKMSITDLQDSIETIQREEFTQVDTLTRELSRSDTTPARRAEIAKQLRSLGAVGLSGAEGQIADIERAVEEADMVEFMGERKSIEDILDNDKISEWIGTYLGLEEGSEAKIQYEEQFGGGFTDWINEHSDALQGLVGGMGETAEAFSTLQETNLASATIIDPAAGDLGTIHEDVMKSLFPDWGGDTWSATNYKEALDSQDWYQVLTMDTAVNPENKQKFIEHLNAIKVDNELGTELSELKANEFKAILNSPDEFKDYLIARQQHNLLPADFTLNQKKDTDFLADYLFGEDLNTTELEDAIERDRIASAVSGDSKSRSDLYNNIITDGMLDADKLLEYLSATKVTGKDSGLANFGSQTTGYTAFSDAGPDKQYNDTVFDSMYKYLKGDKYPTIDNKEIDSWVKENTDASLNMSRNSPLWDKYLLSDAKGRLLVNAGRKARSVARPAAVYAKEFVKNVKNFDMAPYLDIPMDAGENDRKRYAEGLKQLQGYNASMNGVLKDLKKEAGKAKGLLKEKLDSEVRRYEKIKDKYSDKLATFHKDMAKRTRGSLPDIEDTQVGQAAVTDEMLWAGDLYEAQVAKKKGDK